MPPIILLFLSLLLTPAALGAIEAPDPAHLLADWWSDFSPADLLVDEALRARTTRFDLAMEKLRSQLETDQRKDSLPGVARVRELAVA
jgi:hypothetical protein